MQVLYGGTLDMGTSANPIRNVSAEVVFRDVRIDLNRDPGQYGNGLIVLGNAYIHGAELNRTFAESQGDLLKGQSTFAILGQLPNWKSGDSLIVPDSRQRGYGEKNYTALDQYETVEFSSALAGAISIKARCSSIT